MKEILTNTSFHTKIEQLLGISDLQVERSLENGIYKGGYCVETGGLWFGQKEHDLTERIPDHLFKWRKGNAKYGLVIKGENIPLQEVQFNYDLDAIDGLGGYHNYQGKRYQINQARLLDMLKDLLDSQPPK